MNKELSKKNQVFRIVISFLLFAFLIFLYVNEVKWISNTIHFENLLGLGAAIGASLGLLIALYFASKAEETISEFQIIVGLTLVGTFIMPLFFSLANRLLANSDYDRTPMEMIRNDSFVESRFGKIEKPNPDGYFAFFKRGNDIIRVRSRENVFENYDKGDLVPLPINKGLFGYDVVYPELLNDE